MGLLGDSLTDPQSLAVLQLAGGLLSPGSFGQGLSRGLTGYQGALMNAQEMAAKKQAMDLQNIQMQQQKRMFDLQTPFLEEAVRRMQGGQTNAAMAPPAAATSALEQGAGLGSIGPTTANAARMDAIPPARASDASPANMQRTGSMFPGVPDNVAFGMIGTGGFSKIPEVIQKYNEPTEFAKMLVQAGIDPQSAIGRQLIQANIAKSNYVAPVNARPGSILRDAFSQKPVAFNPTIPEGGSPVFDASGNVTAVNPIPGVNEIVRGLSAAKAGGTAQYTPYAGFTATGQPAPVQSVANVLGGGAPAAHPTVTPDAQLKAMQEALPLKLAERDAMPPGKDREALNREIQRDQNAILRKQPFSASTGASSGTYAAPPLGAVAEADATSKHSAENAVSSYNQIHSAAQTAPRTIGLLQTISQLADKTMVGPGSDKVQFVNGVLNTLGITPGADQAQNYQIMKKNLNMIVGAQRSAAGGGGTDALQNLLEAANPDVKAMNAPALKEAAQELIAYQRMLQAHDRILPNPKETSTLNFQKAQTQLSRFSDPRLWQLEHAENDAERVRIMSLIPQAERAELMKKAGEARKMGLLN